MEPESSTEPDWRRVVAALNNPYAREVFAQVALGYDAESVGGGLGGARRRKVLDSLTRAGLVRESGAVLEVRPEAFSELLAASVRPPRASGPERFLDAVGMIDRYPAGGADLRALLTLVAERVLDPGEVVSEKELGGRLRTFTRDVAVLRRHLVDQEILERTPSGSEYARVL